MASRWMIALSVWVLAAGACGDDGGGSDDDDDDDDGATGFSIGSGANGSGANGSGNSGAGAAGNTGTGATGNTGAGNPGDPFDAARQACVDKINTLRGSIGLGPLARWTSAESCSDGEAASDGASGQPHGAFGQCQENAQNECPGYPSVDAVIGTCLDQMWAEGPGEDFNEHGHYINMTSTSYTQVACGFAETADGIWAVQNFQ